MRTLLHLLSILLALPGIALAVAFVALGHAIATGSLFDVIGQFLDVLVWLLPWGFLAICATLLALVAGGLSARFRWLAAACVAVLAISSTAVVFVLVGAHSNFSAGQLWFALPALLSAATSLWLAVTGRPRRVRAADAS